MSSDKCVLTDVQLQDLYNAMNENQAYGGTALLLGKLRADIVSALYELIERRKYPNMPDAEELIAIDEADDEARRDALD